MDEHVKLVTKAPEARREDTVYQTRKPEPSQSMSSPVDRILSLQRTIGNQAVQRMIKSGVIQAKLRIGRPGDRYEREADQVAEQVRHVPKPKMQRQSEEEKKEEELIQPKFLLEQITPLVQRQVEENGEEETVRPKFFSAEHPIIQRQVEPEEEEEEKTIQPKETSGQPPEVTPDFESRIHALKGSGKPLPKSVRNFFEPRFGYDFSPVRIHADSNAVQFNRELNAQAFTHGRDVYFGRRRYNLNTSSGKKLLAHELTHVVQQSGKFLSKTTPEQAANKLSHYAYPHSQVSRFHYNEDPISISYRTNKMLTRFPSPSGCHTFRRGLSYVKPIIKKGYDGTAYTAIKSGWEKGSWRRRWQIYDAEDTLLYEESYTWPSPTLHIPKDVVARGKAGGSKKPWSAWIKVTRTLVPFGRSDPGNFPHSYMKFYVYDTWDEFMTDPKARLSDIPQKAGEKQPTSLKSTTVSGGRSVVNYSSTVVMHEAYLREVYNRGTRAITETAQVMLQKGVPQGDAAKWAVEARNQLKATIREQGNAILKKVFESRNLAKYGNKLGPSYQKLYNELVKKGLSPEEINSKIIKGSGKANIKVNRWAGRLKIAGRILIFLDIALAGVRVALAPEGQRVKVALQEVARIAGALAFGAMGAKGGAAAGAAIGALFGGVGAVPGAIIGGIIGGVGGAFFGGWLAKSIVEKIYEMFPPSDCVFEGDYVEEER